MLRAEVVTQMHGADKTMCFYPGLGCRISSEQKETGKEMARRPGTIVYSNTGT